MGAVALLSIPFLVLFGIIELIRKHLYFELGFSVLFFAVYLLTGNFAISQSYSSTAGIGLFFLPYLAAICAGLAWVFIHYRKAVSRQSKFLSWVCLGLSIIMLGLNLNGISAAKKRAEDTKKFEVQNTAWVEKSFKAVKEILKQNPGHEMEMLGKEIELHRADPHFLNAALATPFVSETQLSELSVNSRRQDYGVILSVIRNPNVTPAILASIYAENKAYPQNNTILTDLAEHPSLPAALISELTQFDDLVVLSRVLHNPSLTCADFRNLQTSYSRNHQPEPKLPSHLTCF